MKETLDFIASIISSLAWPVALLVGLLVLKNPLKTLLARVNKIKYKEAEAEFGKEFEKVKAEAEKVDLGIGRKTTSKKGERTLLEEVREIAKVSPEAAIPFAWIKVENALQKAVERITPKNDIKYYYNNNIKYNSINETIGENLYNIIIELRNLRNKVLHENEKTKVSLNDAIEYGQMAEMIINNINNLKKK